MSNRIILETVEDVNNLDQDFILFIGTSHTVGECQRGDQQHLDQSLVWTEILSLKYNIKYVKLAYGGAENWNILLMLNSFIKDCSNFSKRCKLIIADVRLGSYVPFVSQESLSPSKGSMTNTNINKWIVPSSHAWQTEQTLKDRYLPHMISNHFHVWGPDLIHNITNNGSHWSGNDAAVNRKSLESFLDVYIETWGTSYAWQRCFYEIVHMSNYAEMYNIPFRWFAFNDNTLDVHNRNETITRWIDLVKYSVKEEYSEVWNQNLLSDDTMSSLLDSDKSRNTCECGHWDETFQQEIANIMHNKLTESGIKI